MSDPTPATETAVVTGASRGFGRAIAGALTAAGTTVAGVARDATALTEARDELGERFIPVTGGGRIARITSFNDPALVPMFGQAPVLAP
jgi:NAD(P)-dependent dehydrogenase (short-subunit alcohol dehydrogenase family)